MAKTAAGGGRRRGADTGPRSDADRIIDAALSRMASDGWCHLSLAAIADAAELPILRVYRIFGSKEAILRGLYRRVDEATLAELPSAEPAERRRELPRDPVTVLCTGSSLLRSMRWMLEGADIATGGFRGTLAVNLTAAAYLSTMRVWQRDDSPDLARTMAALDARLRRIEHWLAPTDRRRRDEELIPP